MVANRITNLDILNRGLFTAIYGDTDDVFIGPDMRCYDFDQQLYLYLKSKGFDTVVFFDQNNLYHSYCENDLLRFQQFETKQTVKQKPAPRYKANFKTPLNGRIRLHPGSNGQVEDSALETAHPSIMRQEKGGDTIYRLWEVPEIYKKLGSLFDATQTKIALIVKSPSNVKLEPFDLFESLFATIKAKYKKRTLGHKIIIVYNGRDEVNFVEQFQLLYHKEMTFFSSLFHDAFIVNSKSNEALSTPSNNCFSIDLPDQAEISDFLHYRRLTDHFKIDLSKFDQLVRNLHNGKGRKKWNGDDLRHISQKDIDRLSESTKGTGKALQKLNDLIGLRNVKSTIEEMLIDIRAHQERVKRGLVGREIKFEMNYVFAGNPGTGKTTVARLLGEILAEIGALQEGHLVPTDREGLVGGYVGQSAIKTQEKIEEALNGVLLIDEAYSLLRGGEKDFGQEVIDKLVYSMTESRYMGNMSFVVAGYPKEMEAFVSSNPGLSRRFTKIIHFDDYSSSELVTIFEAELNANNYTAGERVTEKAYVYFESLQRDESFGNAGVAVRFARQVISNLNSRLDIKKFQVENDELNTIEQEDVPGSDPSRSLADEVLPKFNPSDQTHTIIRQVCDEVEDVLIYVIAALQGEVDFAVPMDMLENDDFQQKVKGVLKYRNDYSLEVFEDITYGLEAFRLFFKGILHINNNEIEEAVHCFRKSYEIARTHGIDGLEETNNFLMKYWNTILTLKESDFKNVHQKLVELKQDIQSSGVNEHFKQMSDLMQADIFFISALNAISQDDTQQFSELIGFAAESTDKVVDEYFNSDTKADAKLSAFFRSVANFYRSFGDIVILFNKVDQDNFDLTAELVSLDIHTQTAQSYLSKLDLSENVRISNVFYMVQAFRQFQDFLKELSVVMLNYNTYRHIPDESSVTKLKELVKKAEASLKHIQDEPLDPWISICNSMIEYVANIGSETQPAAFSKNFGQLANNFKGLANENLSQVDVSDREAVKARLTELFETGHSKEAMVLLKMHKTHIKDKELLSEVMFLLNRFFENRKKWDLRLITHENGLVDENIILRSMLPLILSKL